LLKIIATWRCRLCRNARLACSAAVDREPARELLAAKELSQFVEREIARDAGTNGRVQQ